ncbi:uncharacterized protein [Nicotiana sylvestris]|uniref:uncharacterized protein n=1 Tax=Nicotiana sylvestris TaxID=4096 RepID=UPI00388CD815
MKDLMTKKQSMNFETIKVTHQVSAIVHSMAPKLEDPDAFKIPYTIRSSEFAKALCNLGASINLMPYSVFKTLGIGKPRPTSMRLQMADRTMKRPLGVLKMFWRPFFATGKALCDIKARELTFRVGGENVVFYVCKSMGQPNSNELYTFVDLVTDIIIDETSAMINVGDMLEVILLNFDDGVMDGFMECVNSLQGTGSYNYTPQKLSLYIENRTTPPTKPSIKEPPTLEWKSLSPHLRYEFLGPCSTLPVKLSSCLTNVQKQIWCSIGRSVISGCPYGTFTFKRMSFGLCNALATFRRCMMAIFTDMVEDYLEVFMDDFSVVGDSFDNCLSNLD